MRVLLAFLCLLAVSVPLVAAPLQPGAKAPDVTATDQHGKERTLSSLMGPKGLVLVFIRSAGWCPYCKTQLDQLQKSLPGLQKRGLGVAAVSYDPAGVLKDFATRHSITYPLLSDPVSNFISEFGALNPRSRGREQGISLPGTYLLSPDLHIRKTWFETEYSDAALAQNPLLKAFPALIPSGKSTLAAPRVNVLPAQSDSTATYGSKIMLLARVHLPEGLHVYGPGVLGGYRPLKLVFDETSSITLGKTSYPVAQRMALPGTPEPLPVYMGEFTVRQEVTLPPPPPGRPGRKTLTLNAHLDYQECSDTVCYPPSSTSWIWRIVMEAP